jgi:hypothetical protein
MGGGVSIVAVRRQYCYNLQCPAISGTLHHNRPAAARFQVALTCVELELPKLEMQSLKG